MAARVARARRNEKAHAAAVPAERQQDNIALRLLYFIYSHTRDARRGLARDGAQTNSVKRHRITPIQVADNGSDFSICYAGRACQGEVW
jgi:hypothetical protein